MNNEVFKVKDEHIILLKNMYTSWNDMEFGAPSVDPKRPYGDSCVLEDMAKILNIKCEVDEYGDEELTDEQSDKLLEFHKEMETVLQILLYNCSIQTGTYERNGYTKEWTFIK